MSDFLFRGSLADLDPDVYELTQLEAERQCRKLILIPSESRAPLAVREAMSSAFQNVYAEGYPDEETRRMSEKEILDYPRRLAHYRRYSDLRYYKGVEYADTIEALARRRCAEAFAANVDFTDTLFDAAYEYSCKYMDMAMTGLGAEMGSRQLASHAAREKKGLLAILGMGVDPGVSDIFAKYAEQHLFDEVEEIGVRDGAALEIAGYDFAPTFSIADTLEECTSPPVIWEKDKGWFTTELFSEPEIFEFPEGIGPLECVNVEHEEVVLIPRWVKTKRVTFKYALGDKFIQAIKILHMLGLTSKVPVNVKGVKVAPSEVVAACLPDPAHLGDKMTGKTCVGTWAKGMKDGRERQVYLYQSTDNDESMGKYDCQAVSWQTGVCPAIAMELLAEGIWKGKGVLGPEAFDPVPFLEKMPEFDFPYGIKEM